MFQHPPVNVKVAYNFNSSSCRGGTTTALSPTTSSILSSNAGGSGGGAKQTRKSIGSINYGDSKVYREQLDMYALACVILDTFFRAAGCTKGDPKTTCSTSEDAANIGKGVLNTQPRQPALVQRPLGLQLQQYQMNANTTTTSSKGKGTRTSTKGKKMTPTTSTTTSLVGRAAQGVSASPPGMKMFYCPSLRTGAAGGGSSASSSKANKSPSSTTTSSHQVQDQEDENTVAIHSVYLAWRNYQKIAETANAKLFAYSKACVSADTNSKNPSNHQSRQLSLWRELLNYNPAERLESALCELDSVFQEQQQMALHKDEQQKEKAPIFVTCFADFVSLVRSMMLAIPVLSGEAVVEAANANEHHADARSSNPSSSSNSSNCCNRWIQLRDKSRILRKKIDEAVPASCSSSFSSSNTMLLEVPEHNENDISELQSRTQQQELQDARIAKSVVAKDEKDELSSSASSVVLRPSKRGGPLKRMVRSTLLVGVSISPDPDEAGP
ncbi:unnamed protein product [Amoebophrya sp. A25]|nr:unnamed protein product [Amoebophrya sp. A25]|eukprot:GSA25T00023798001.1